MAPPQFFDNGRRNSPIVAPNVRSPTPQNPASIPEVMPPPSPSEQTVTDENQSSIPVAVDNSDVPPVAPGDRVIGSTGRTKRRRSIDISGVLEASHENLVSCLDKQMTQRMLFYDIKQLELQQAKVEIEKVEQESLSTDRRAIVSVLKEVANAMNILARR
ncbi:unnamed protein product [Calypogeia fissa]